MWLAGELLKITAINNIKTDNTAPLPKIKITICPNGVRMPCMSGELWIRRM
jgi:hypothetical protein